MVRCVSHRHTLSHTRSQSHWGWRVGAGSGRQLRKRPRSPPSLPPYPPLLLPRTVPAPGAAWPGPGNSSASRRLQAPRNPIPTQPRAEPGRGAQSPPQVRDQPSHPHGRLTAPPPDPETAPAPSWDSTWSALTTTPPSWNPTVETAASLGHDPSDL